MPPKGRKLPTPQVAKISATADMRKTQTNAKKTAAATKSKPKNTATTKAAAKKPVSKQTTTAATKRKPAPAKKTRQAAIRRRQAQTEDPSTAEPSMWSKFLTGVVDYFKALPVPIAGIPMDARQRAQAFGVHNGNPILGRGEFRAEKGAIDAIPGSREAFVRWCWDGIQTGKWDLAKLAGIPINDLTNQIYNYFRSETGIGKALTHHAAKDPGVLADLRNLAGSLRSDNEEERPPSPDMTVSNTGSTVSLSPTDSTPRNSPVAPFMADNRSSVPTAFGRPFRGISDENEPMDEQAFIRQMKELSEEASRNENFTSKSSWPF